jgi:EmrB/QacA subfamily drug resistance transporter
MLILDITVINTALSRIESALSTGLGGVQWILDGYTLPLAALVLTAGALADRFGRRRLFIIGLVIFTAASAVCGAAGSIDVLDAARAVQGVGAALLFAVSLALIAHATPQAAERTKAMALYGATIGLGLAIGPLVGGALTQAISWRAIFLVNLPFGCVAMWLAVTRVAESKDTRIRPVDWPGQVSLIAGLLGITLGLLRGNASGWSSALVLSSLTAGALLLIAFVVLELRQADPMLPLGLFRKIDFAGVQLSVFGISASSFAIYLYLSIYLQQTLGRSPLETGLAYLPGSFLMFGASMVTPKLVTRLGPGRLATLALSLCAGGLACLLLTRTDSSWTVTLPGTLLIMTGAGFYNPVMSMLAMSVLPEEQHGIASGAYDTFRQSGLALGTAALGAFIPAGALAGGSGHAYVTPFHHAVWAALGIGVAAALGTGWLLGRRRAAAAAPQITVVEAVAGESPDPDPVLDVLAEGEAA